MPLIPIIAAATGVSTAIGVGTAALVGATVSTVAATAIGTGIVAGAVTALQGGDAGDVLESAITGGVTSFIGGSIGEAVFGGAGAAAASEVASEAAFVAADASQLAAQGLGQAQIASTLTASGVSEAIAATAAAAAVTGASQEAISSALINTAAEGGTVLPGIDDDAAFIAADAEQLVQQGLGADQIADTLVRSGVDSLAAYDAAQLAVQGLGAAQIAEGLVQSSAGADTLFVSPELSKVQAQLGAEIMDRAGQTGVDLNKIIINPDGRAVAPDATGSYVLLGDITPDPGYDSFGRLIDPEAAGLPKNTIQYHDPVTLDQLGLIPPNSAMTRVREAISNNTVDQLGAEYQPFIEEWQQGIYQGKDIGEPFNDYRDILRQQVVDGTAPSTILTDTPPALTERIMPADRYRDFYTGVNRDLEPLVTDFGTVYEPGSSVVEPVIPEPVVTQPITQPVTEPVVTQPVVTQPTEPLVTDFGTVVEPVTEPVGSIDQIRDFNAQQPLTPLEQGTLPDNTVVEVVVPDQTPVVTPPTTLQPLETAQPLDNTVVTVDAGDITQQNLAIANATEDPIAALNALEGYTVSDIDYLESVNMPAAVIESARANNALLGASPTTPQPEAQEPLTPLEQAEPIDNTVAEVVVPEATYDPSVLESLGLGGLTDSQIAKLIAAGVLAPAVAGALGLFENQGAIGYEPLNYQGPAPLQLRELVMPGVNPGFMPSQPMYNLQDQTQPQYYWGTGPYLTSMAQLGEPLQFPNAPQQPFGSQPRPPSFDVNQFITTMLSPQAQAAAQGTSTQFYQAPEYQLPVVQPVQPQAMQQPVYNYAAENLVQPVAPTQ